MDAPSPNKTHCFYPVAESDGSTAQRSASSAIDGRTCRKRETSPGDETPRKKAKVSDSEPQGSSEKNLKMSTVLRKMKELIAGVKNPASTSEDSGRGSGGSMSQQSAPSTGQKKRTASPDERSPRKRAKGSDSDRPCTSENKLGKSRPRSLTELTSRQNMNSRISSVKEALDVSMAVITILPDKSGKELPIEVAIMLKLAPQNSHSKGASAPVALLDRYDLYQELILVLERPVPEIRYAGSLARSVILKQLVDAAKYLEKKQIFHLDIELENVLTETGTNVPGVWVLDFGLNCFSREGSSYSLFFGTEEHIPPERYRCGNYSSGPTSVWQVGVILYEFLHTEPLTPSNL